MLQKSSIVIAAVVMTMFGLGASGPARADIVTGVRTVGFDCDPSTRTATISVDGDGHKTQEVTHVLRPALACNFGRTGFVLLLVLESEEHSRNDNVGIFVDGMPVDGLWFEGDPRAPRKVEIKFKEGGNPEYCASSNDADAPPQCKTIAVEPALKKMPKPSFDCATAKAAVDKLVCGDRWLPAADLALANSYSAAQAATHDRAGRLRAEQRQWLASRATACHLPAGAMQPTDGDWAAAAQCLNDLYVSRIDALNAIAGQPTAGVIEGFGLMGSWAEDCSNVSRDAIGNSIRFVGPKVEMDLATGDPAAAASKFSGRYVQMLDGMFVSPPFENFPALILSAERLSNDRIALRETSAYLYPGWATTGERSVMMDRTEIVTATFLKQGDNLRTPVRQGCPRDFDQGRKGGGIWRMATAGPTGNDYISAMLQLMGDGLPHDFGGTYSPSYDSATALSLASRCAEPSPTMRRSAGR